MIKNDHVMIVPNEILPENVNRYFVIFNGFPTEIKKFENPSYHVEFNKTSNSSQWNPIRIEFIDNNIQQQLKLFIDTVNENNDGYKRHAECFTLINCKNKTRWELTATTIDVIVDENNSTTILLKPDTCMLIFN